MKVRVARRLRVREPARPRWVGSPAAPVVRPANDNWANATYLGSATSGTTTGDNTNATTEASEPGLTFGNTLTVWWKWTAPTTGTATFSTAGSAVADTVLIAYTGSALASLTQIALNDDEPTFSGPDFFHSRVTFNVTAGTTYYLQVNGYGSADHGGLTLSWSTSANTWPITLGPFSALPI